MRLIASSGRKEVTRKMREKTYRTAFGGIMAALATVMLFLGSVFPFAEIAGPAVASVCVLLTAAELSSRAAVMVWLSVSLLSVMTVPDKEAAMLFTVFFGWFPLLKKAVEKKMSFVPGLLVKIAAFNLSVIGSYWVVLNLIKAESFTQEFAEYSTAMYIAVVVLSNITMLTLDYALSKILLLYVNVWRPRIVREDGTRR